MIEQHTPPARNEQNGDGCQTPGPQQGARTRTGGAGYVLRGCGRAGGRAGGSHSL